MVLWLAMYYSVAHPGFADVSVSGAELIIYLITTCTYSAIFKPILSPFDSAICHKRYTTIGPKTQGWEVGGGPELNSKI